MKIKITIKAGSPAHKIFLELLAQKHLFIQQAQQVGKKITN